MSSRPGDGADPSASDVLVLEAEPDEELRGVAVCEGGADGDAGADAPELVEDGADGPRVLERRVGVGELEGRAAVDRARGDLGAEAEHLLAEDDVLTRVAAVIEGLAAPAGAK